MVGYAVQFLPEGAVVEPVALWWHEAEAASQSGQLPRARRFLRWILACCPDDEDAWLWLARLTADQEERLRLLRQAYGLHPDSTRVRAALRQARNEQLQSAVGALKPRRALLRCLPDERRRSNGNRFVRD